jgi:hypothetical protein
MDDSTIGKKREQKMQEKVSEFQVIKPYVVPLKD